MSCSVSIGTDDRICMSISGDSLSGETLNRAHTIPYLLQTVSQIFYFLFFLFSTSHDHHFSPLQYKREFPVIRYRESFRER